MGCVQSKYDMCYSVLLTIQNNTLEIEESVILTEALAYDIAYGKP